ncbi:MAG TPA: hypothetical protein VEC16_07240 [Alphaproteobacteria bacterium]|nr:hypothetical protein [Alphaproteobacteria bacterium]
MEFPEESVALAKEIAGKYRLRQSTHKGLAKMLYKNAFLEIQYGFDEAIKTGKVASYLHEVKSMCDCDSMAGIQYLVAKELGFEPEIYSAYGMRQINLGQNLEDAKSGSHTFILINLHGKKVIVDPFYVTYGEVKFENANTMRIVNNAASHAEKVIRACDSLVKLTKEEYLQRFENTRAKGGREALSVGRRISSNGYNVTLNFNENENTLTSFITLNLIKNLLHDNNYSTHAVHALIANVSDDGKWHSEDGKLSLFYSSNSVWAFENFKNQHIRTDIPMPLVKEYLSNMETANSATGKKSRLADLEIHNVRKYLYDLGIDFTGELIANSKFDNKIDRKKHAELMSKLQECLPKSENPNIMPYIVRDAAYFTECQKRRSEKNPEWFVYSEKERNALEDEYIEKIRDEGTKTGILLTNTTLASAGLLKNKKLHSENIDIFLNNETQTTTYKIILSQRKKERHQYDSALDFSLYQKDHPLGTLKISEEELRKYYMAEMHVGLLRTIDYIEALELKGKRRGLEKLLKK